MAAVVFTVADQAGPRIKLNGGQTPLRLVKKTITCDGGDASASGNALTAAQLGVTAVVWAQASARGAGYVHQYDPSGEKLYTYIATNGGGALTASTGALSHTIDMLILGTE